MLLGLDVVSKEWGCREIKLCLGLRPFSHFWFSRKNRSWNLGK